MFVKMHDGHDKNRFSPDLVNNSIGKPARAATASTLRQHGPSVRVLNNSSERPFDLSGEFEAQPLALQVIVGYGLDKLSLRRLKEIDIHEVFRLSILSNTLLAAVALIFL